MITLLELGQEVSNSFSGIHWGRIGNSAEVQGLHDLVEALEDRLAVLEAQHKDTQETAYEALNLIENIMEAEGGNIGSWNQALEKNGDDFTLLLNRRNLELLVMLVASWFLTRYTENKLAVEKKPSTEPYAGR